MTKWLRPRGTFVNLGVSFEDAVDLVELLPVTVTLVV